MLQLQQQSAGEVYSQWLASYWSHVKYVLSGWHPNWSHVKYTLYGWHPIGPRQGFVVLYMKRGMYRLM